MASSSYGFHELPGREPGQGHHQRPHDMRPDRAERPGPTALLEMRYDFGGERGKSGQPAAEASDDEQSPFRRKIRRFSEKSDREPDNIAADHIGGKGAGRNVGEKAVQADAELPAQQRPGRGAEGNGQNGAPDHPARTLSARPDRLRRLSLARGLGAAALISPAPSPCRRAAPQSPMGSIESGASPAPGDRP